MSADGAQRFELPNGIALDYSDTGPQDAPALIFLHGFPENRHSWRHQIAHLSDRFRCIAPDQRGYAGSSKPAGVGSYRADQLVGDIFLLAAELAVERFTIVGHDWGGAIAWGVAMAGQANGKVGRAVIANAPHPAIFQRLLYTDPAQRQASQYMRAFRDPASDALVEQAGLGALLEREISWDAAARMEPDERALLERQWQDREAAIAMLNWYRASPVDVPAPDAPYALPPGFAPYAAPRLTIPTLVIWGMEDRALPPANIAGLDTLIDDLIVHEMPGAGHFVQWEAPREVNRALDAFLEATAY